MKVSAILTTLGMVLFLGFVVLFSIEVEEVNLNPVGTIDSLSTAVRAGDMNTAAAGFSKKGSAALRATEQLVQGPAGIWRFLVKMHQADRRYKISSSTISKHKVMVTVDISDGGHVWGQQIFTAEISRGKAIRFDVNQTRLMLWRISRPIN